MLKRLIKSKRGLSPIVTTLFLMAIIIAAIAVSLGIIYPNVQELNEEIDLELASSAMIDLNQDLQVLMISGTEGKITKNLNLGSTGTLFGDSISSSIIILGLIDSSNIFTVLSAASPSQINLTQSRMIIRQSTTESNVPKNSNAYLTGSSEQNFFYLNSTNQRNSPWEILNQSRFNDKFLFTSLSYRQIITTDTIITPKTLEVNLTISIQTVQFNFISRNQSLSNQPFVSFEYHGLDVQTYNWTKILYDPFNKQSFALKTITSLWNVGTIPIAQTSIEIPYSIEIPTSGVLNVRVQILTHMIDVDI